MKNTKRFISVILVLVMAFSVFGTGTVASAADSSNSSPLKEVVLEPVARPKVQFYCDTVTRVAKAVGSVEVGTTIVKATPSGVPELSGDYAARAYAGETPSATRITFVSPTAGISITGFSCSNESVTFTDMSFTAPGTYNISITGGTATAGDTITFTIDYTWTDGNVYQEKCVTYVENIVTGGVYAEHRVTWKPYNGNSSWYRGYASAITRVLGKGVYYEAPATSGATLGVYNVATKSFTENSGAGYFTSYYENEREESAGIFNNPRETIDHTAFVTNVSQAHIYIDKSEVTSLADINLRIDANVGNEIDELHVRNNDDPNVALGESYVYFGAQTTAPSSYANNADVQNVIGYSVPARSDYGFGSENGAYHTITSGARNGNNIITSYLTGAVSNISDSFSCTVINRYYAYFRGSYAYITNSPIVPVVMNFHIVDKTVLREMIDYVMSSDPTSPAIRNQQKGVNPQSWYYTSGFNSFQEAYVDALRVLNNPKALQTEIDSKANALKQSYTSLALKGADYSEVNELKDIAEEMVKSECYPASDTALLNEALGMVKTGYNILYQSAVDTMAYNLRVAIERAIPLPAEYDAIRSLEREYYDMDLSIYTSESIKAVDDAFAKVDYTLTRLEQSKVDDWEAEIRTAMENLNAHLADFSVLISVLASAKAIDPNLYANGSVLLEPIEAAEDAIAENKLKPWGYLKQTTVDELTENLRRAMGELIPADADKLGLEEAINAEIPGDRLYYDQDVLAAYMNLVATGREMYNDASLTIRDQQKIDAMTSTISAKYQELMATYSEPEITAYFKEAENSTTFIDKENGIIYGLSDEGLESLEGYVEYDGGELEYEYVDEFFGTGTKVNFIVKGEIFESYTVVIFGDIYSDGVIDNYDVAVVSAYINGDTEIEDGSPFCVAADVYADGVIDSYDLAVLIAYVNGNSEITQKPDYIII